MKTGITGSSTGESSVALADEDEAVVSEQANRLRCGCGAWHSGRHDIDGVIVASMLCRRHASDQHRSQWATLPPSDDPRIEQLRHKPHNIRRAMMASMILAIEGRDDLIDPPGKVDPMVTGDNRVDYMPLADALAAADRMRSS